MRAQNVRLRALRDAARAVCHLCRVEAPLVPPQRWPFYGHDRAQDGAFDLVRCSASPIWHLVAEEFGEEKVGFPP